MTSIPVTKTINDKNKIIKHTAYVDNWDTGDQETIDYEKTFHHFEN